MDWDEDAQKITTFIERRKGERRNNVGNILTYLGMAKYAIPVIDAAIAEVKVAVPVEKTDVQVAVTAVEKAVADLKVAIENLITAVKAAIASS